MSVERTFINVEVGSCCSRHRFIYGVFLIGLNQHISLGSGRLHMTAFRV
jgi:hypothetical protein